MAKRSKEIEDDVRWLDYATFRKKYRNYEVRCGILLIRAEDSKVLVVKERPRRSFRGNVYGPPKGHINASDHSFMQAALRELREETGICLDPPASSESEIVLYHTYFNEMLILFPTIVSNPPEPCPDYQEISECRWMTLEELANSRISNATRCMTELLLNITRTYTQRAEP